MKKIFYSERSFDDLKNIQMIKKFDHANRNSLFNLSRLALGDIINYQSNTFFDWRNIKLINHSKIENLSEYTCSLTHSKETSISVASKTTNVQSLGVDLEFSDRPIKEGSERFYINEFDTFLTENPLLKWCIKEACFKALSNNGHPIKLLKEVVVNGNNFYFDDEADGNLNQFLILDDDDKLIVVAYCLREPSEEQMDLVKVIHA